MKQKPNLGGKRPGAGRPYGSGIYGEKTFPMRIPESLSEKINSILTKYKNKVNKHKKEKN